MHGRLHAAFFHGVGLSTHLLNCAIYADLSSHKKDTVYLHFPLIPGGGHKLTLPSFVAPDYSADMRLC
jgi:hypothetical protein